MGQMRMLTVKELQKLKDILEDFTDEGPPGLGYASKELQALRGIFSGVDLVLVFEGVRVIETPAVVTPPVFENLEQAIAFFGEDYVKNLLQNQLDRRG